MSVLASRVQSILPWVWTVSIVLIGLPLVVVAGVRGLVDAEVALQVMLAFVYAVLGLVIAVRQRGNGVAWILLAVATSIVLNGCSVVILDEPSSASWRVAATIWSNSGYFVAFLIPLLLLLYIFPTGHFLSRRWSWAGWAAAISSAIVVFAEGFASEVALDGQSVSISNPIGFHSIGGTDDGLVGLVFGVLLLALIVGGPLAIVARYRRSSSDVRSQIKLVVVSMALVPLIFLTGIFLGDSWFNTVVFFAAMTAVPIAITVAIVRHNLYEIDLVISRTVTFGVLVVFIGGVYVGIVVGVGALVGRGGGSGFGLSVVATAVVALGFQPVRVRVERWANRLVFGRRATPYEVLARFSHRAAEESDGDVVGRIPRLIVDGTGAAGAAVWVRSGGGFEAVSVWPGDGVRSRIEGVAVFDDPGADVSLPVFHDGELLGGISLVNARGGSITPPEEELLSNLADGLGLTLRNSRLTAALRRQVVELERSRDRVVSAADEARRSLEHDLDSGPQQQLVAVKVKLGPIRRLAEQAGAERTAGVLADIEAQTGDAIRAVRDFAAGIYPPLLGAEGLAVALGQEVHKAALPVEVVADGVGRYPREVESAVYFSILEALQNTAKYGQASRAVVTLSAADGGLSFEVSDDGVGFDPATVTYGAGLNGIRDRLDTIGATWTITSTPGHGTLITGTVPIGARVTDSVGVA